MHIRLNTFRPPIKMYDQNTGKYRLHYRRELAYRPPVAADVIMPCLHCVAALTVAVLSPVYGANGKVH